MCFCHSMINLISLLMFKYDLGFSFTLTDNTPGGYSVFFYLSTWTIMKFFTVRVFSVSFSSPWASRSLSWQTLYISAVTSWRSTLSYIVYEKTPKALSSYVLKETPSHMMMMMIWHVMSMLLLLWFFWSSLVVGCEYFVVMLMGSRSSRWGLRCGPAPCLLLIGLKCLAHGLLAARVQRGSVKVCFCVFSMLIYRSICVFID